MNFKKIALLTLTCLLLALTGCGAKEDPSAAGEETPGKSGLFTAMETVDLDGNTVDSSVFADKTLTLVNVWNLGCTPCVQEVPHLDKLNDDLAEQGVAVIGLYYNFGQELAEEERTAIQDLFAESGADYTQILASEAMMEFDELGQIQAFPTTFFVDSEGSIVDTVMGSNDYDGWKTKIDKVLADLEG